jgi:hypothetical protein
MRLCALILILLCAAPAAVTARAAGPQTPPRLEPVVVEGVKYRARTDDEAARSCRASPAAPPSSIRRRSSRRAGRIWGRSTSFRA